MLYKSDIVHKCANIAKYSTNPRIAQMKDGQFK
jgi:hypothetical protein